MACKGELKGTGKVSDVVLYRERGCQTGGKQMYCVCVCMCISHDSLTWYSERVEQTCVVTEGSWLLGDRQYSSSSTSQTEGGRDDLHGQRYQLTYILATPNVQ